MIERSLRNPKTNEKYTNVEIIKTMYDALKELHDPADDLPKSKQQQMLQDFYEIAGHTENGVDPMQAERVYEYVKQIAEAPASEAQDLFANTCIGMSEAQIKQLTKMQETRLNASTVANKNKK